MRFADPCEEDPYIHHLVETDDGSVRGTTPCGVYTAAHIRLHRTDVSRWRRLRAEALVDLPNLIAMGRILEQLRLVASDSEREDLDAQIGALNRRIEESKVRFCIG